MKPNSSEHEEIASAERPALDIETAPTNKQTPTLTQAHHDYLIQRHGTVDLDPLPSLDHADPLNWPSWKKNTNLALVAFHNFMTTFIAAGVIPAFEDISVDLGVSLKRASYLTSAQIAVLGASPLFWKPFSSRYGRRPVWLLSTLLSGVCNVGCAVSHDYASMMACRCLVAFFISPAMAIGSGVVVETFFKRERGTKMGIWTLMFTLGPPTGPFLMGFVAYHVGYRWVYWCFAITNAVQMIAYLFLSPESRYMRASTGQAGAPPTSETKTFQKEYLSFRRIDPTPFSLFEFIQPLFLGKHLTILLPTIAYSIVFGFAGVFLTVEIPQIFIPKFEFNPQQLGLQFLGMIIGSVIGEQLSGPLSDWWMTRAKNQTFRRGQNGLIKPEYRLWLSYPGYLLSIVGLIVFGVRLAQAKPLHWNVTPIVGIAIAAAGNQLMTTIVMTYMVDSHQEFSSSIGVFVNFIRSTWGFIGPFWFPNMIDSIGISGSGGLMAGLIFATSVLPTIYVHYFASKHRGKDDQNIAAEHDEKA